MKIHTGISARLYGSALNNAISLMPLFSFTNFVPLSVLGAPFALFGFFSARTLRILLNFPAFAVLIIYTFISALCYDASGFLSPDFYRRDGNFFPTIAVLVCGLTFANEKNAENALRILASIAGVSFIIFWPIEAVILGHKNVHALFVAHNAAGGFFAVMAVLSLFIFDGKRRIFFSALFVIAVFETGSRGSLLGMLLVYVLYFASSNFGLRWLVFGVFLFLTIWIAVWSKSFYGYAGTDLYRQEYSAEALELHAENSEQTGAVVGNSHNVYIRMAIVWPRAVEIFSNYPLLGAGFGAYDDRIYLERTDILAEASEVMHTNSHAHHTFLHVAAEQGVIGFVLLLVSLWTIDRRLSGCPNKLTQAASHTLMLVMLMSLTEHRLYSPSNSVPMMFIISFALLRLDALGKIKAFS
ncbi:O-antigen ligase family protein [Celeribacter halophilus]|uniref:O-antigen ligase family protein n=1 Tax=Celeribacter halophilus TaxID=576117 RepID=UPI0026E1FD3C|nr:O-antigen ligase family protein [Celeribacter halophilus]MDO6724719.1 O-antigen ligase family protein [Celeribacter halophilus]